MSVNVNLSAKKEMSLASLKRRFPSVESILVEASFVAVYRFKKSKDLSKYWTKENVTGPLFVVQHAPAGAAAEHGVVVLNQEGRGNHLLTSSTRNIDLLTFVVGWNDFNLSIDSISIIIPQEEFLMLRYYNEKVIDFGDTFLFY